MAARNGRKRPAPVKPTPADPDDVLAHLQTARSIFACAARCLDEIADPHRVDAPEICDPTDVVVILRLGIETLSKAQAAFDQCPLAGGTP